MCKIRHCGICQVATNSTVMGVRRKTNAPDDKGIPTLVCRTCKKEQDYFFATGKPHPGGRAL